MKEGCDGSRLRTDPVPLLHASVARPCLPQQPPRCHLRSSRATALSATTFSPGRCTGQGTLTTNPPAEQDFLVCPAWHWLPAMHTRGCPAALDAWALSHRASHEDEGADLAHGGCVQGCEVKARLMPARPPPPQLHTRHSPIMRIATRVHAPALLVPHRAFTHHFVSPTGLRRHMTFAYPTAPLSVS